MSKFEICKKGMEDRPEASLFMKFGAVATIAASIFAGCASSPNTDPSEGIVLDMSNRSVSFCADTGETRGVVEVVVEEGRDPYINDLSDKCNGKDPAPIEANKRHAACVDIPEGSRPDEYTVSVELHTSNEYDDRDGKFNPLTADAYITFSDATCEQIQEALESVHNN